LVLPTQIIDFWNLRDGFTNMDFLFFLLGEPLARCKFVSEMSFQVVNIIGETLTNLADFCPFGSVSPIVFYTTPAVLREIYGPITNF